MSKWLQGRWRVAAVGVAAALVAAGGVAAQERGGGIAGVVRDGMGQPLAHARVVALPGGRHAESDGEGRFELRQLPGGRYRLEASLIGYAPVRAEVEVVAGRTAAVSLSMAATPLTLGGLQVTATTGARLPAAVAQATAQLSGRALDRELGTTLAHTLRSQAGVAVRSQGPGAAMPVLRGLTGDRVLVLQDGQRTADLAGSAEDHGVTIDPLAAQRVEIVRGPATLLYGNNALGGVVNVISGDVGGALPTRPEVAIVAQGESAYRGRSVSARGAAPLGAGWAVATRAGTRRTGDMRIGVHPVLGDRLENTAMRSRHGSVALSRAAPGWSGSMALRAFEFGYGLPAPPGGEHIRLQGQRIELAGRAEVGLRLPGLDAARVDVTGQDYGHDELAADGSVAQRFGLATGAVNLLLEQRSLGPFRDGALGAALLLRDYSATGPSALTPEAVSRAAGVFTFQELAVGGDRVALQLGVRLDRYVIESRATPKFGPAVSRTFDALSGSVGVRVPLPGGVSAGLTAARSFRAPTVEELFSGAAHAGTGSVEFGDASLQAERGTSLEALLHVGTGRVQAQVAAWINRVDDYIQLQYRTDSVVAGAVLPVYHYTQAPARLHGAEGSVELVVLPRVALALRGDWLRARTATGVPLSFMPPPRVGLAVRWEGERLSLGADAHHEAAQRRTGSAEEAPTSAHTILRFDAGLRVRLLRRWQQLSVRVDNATDVLHHEATSRVKDFAPGPGRNVSLVLRSWL